MAKEYKSTPCHVLVGTSGWNYETFIGSIYDVTTPKRGYLERYTEFFKTVELNASFYRSFPQKTWQGWYERTPEDFVWAVKAPRFITHIKRLHVEVESVSRFMNQVTILGEKLGVILFQLPPSMTYDPATFEEFAALLPGDIRFAWEVRHESWFCQGFYDSLQARNMAFVISHTAGRYPMAKVFTADFFYIRLHGTQALYRGAYGEDGLKEWIELIKGANRPGFVYFDNTADGSAARDALLLKELLASNGCA